MKQLFFYSSFSLPSYPPVVIDLSKINRQYPLDSLVLVDTTEMKISLFGMYSSFLLSNILRIVRLFLNVDMDMKTTVFIQMVSISNKWRLCNSSCLLWCFYRWRMVCWWYVPLTLFQDWQPHRLPLLTFRFLLWSRRNTGKPTIR